MCFCDCFYFCSLGMRSLVNTNLCFDIYVFKFFIFIISLNYFLVNNEFSRSVSFHFLAWKIEDMFQVNLSIILTFRQFIAPIAQRSGRGSILSLRQRAMRSRSRALRCRASAVRQVVLYAARLDFSGWRIPLPRTSHWSACSRCSLPGRVCSSLVKSANRRRWELYLIYCLYFLTIKLRLPEKGRR